MLSKDVGLCAQTYLQRTIKRSHSLLTIMSNIMLRRVELLILEYKQGNFISQYAVLVRYRIREKMPKPRLIRH